MCCIWGAIRATGWRVGAAGLRARHVWRRGLRGTKTTRMIVLVQIVARYSASAVTHQPNMHCAGGAAGSCAHSPIQRHTMVAAHVLKAPLSPTWKTELLPATLSVALLLKCSNLSASQTRLDSRARSASYLIAISYGSLSSACLRARWAARRVPRAKDGGLPHVLVHLAARLRDQASTMVYTATSVLTSALFGAHIAEISLECPWQLGGSGVSSCAWIYWLSGTVRLISRRHTCD